MRISRVFLHFLFATLISVGAASVALAQSHEGHDHGDKAKAKGEQSGKFLGKGDGVETCPVTAERVSKSVSAELHGRTVYFCCSDCLDKAKANPDVYVKPTLEEQKKAIQKEEKTQTEFLGKGDGIDTCPVTGSPVSKDLKSEVNGRVFYVCCAGCIETVKANPDAYLKKQ